MVSMDATVNDRPFIDINPKVIFVEKVNLVNKVTKFTKDGKMVTFDISDINNLEKEESDANVITEFADNAEVVITDLGTNIKYEQSPEEMGKVFGKSIADFLEKDNTLEAMQNICDLNNSNNKELYSQCHSFNKAYASFKDNTYAFSQQGIVLRNYLKTLGYYGDSYMPVTEESLPSIGNDVLDGFNSLIPLTMKINRYSDVIKKSLQEEIKNNPQAMANFKKIEKIMKNSSVVMLKAMNESLKVKSHLDDADYVELQMKIYDTAERIIVFEDTFRKKCINEGLPYNPVSMFKMNDHRSINYQYFDIVDSIWELGDSIQDLRNQVKFAEKMSENKNDLISASVRDSFKKQINRPKEIEKMGSKLNKDTDLFSNVIDTSFDEKFNDSLKIVSFVENNKKLDFDSKVKNIPSPLSFTTPTVNHKYTEKLLLNKKLANEETDEVFSDLIKDEFKKIDSLNLLDDQKIYLKKATEYSVERPVDIKGVVWFNFNTDDATKEYFRFSEAMEKTNFQSYMHEKIDNKASELLCGLSVRYDKKGNAQFYSYDLRDNGCHRYLLGKKANVYESLMSNATSLYWNDRPVSKDNFLSFENSMKNSSMIPVIERSAGRMLFVCNNVFNKGNYNLKDELVLDKKLIDDITSELDKVTRKSIKQFEKDRKRILSGKEYDSPLIKAVKQQLYKDETDNSKKVTKVKANIYEKGVMP